MASCSEKKEGKVIVTEQEFSIRQDAEYNWVIDAGGKLKMSVMWMSKKWWSPVIVIPAVKSGTLGFG